MSISDSFVYRDSYTYAARFYACMGDWSLLSVQVLALTMVPVRGGSSR